MRLSDEWPENLNDKFTTRQDHENEYLLFQSHVSYVQRGRELLIPEEANFCADLSQKIQTPGEQENGDGDNTRRRRRMEYLKIRVQRPDGEIIFNIIVIIMSAEISAQLLN